MERMDRKTSVSVAISMRQLERLTKIIEHTRISRSVLVREAVEQLLQRYEKEIAGGNGAAGREDDGAVRARKTRRRI